MVPYEFYANTYHGGAVPYEDWPQFEARASEQLARYKRIYTVKAPEDYSEAFAVCAIAEDLYDFQQAESGENRAPQSASIGSVSVTYGSAASIDTSPKAKERELYRRACMYLDIYRGCG